MRAPHDAFFRYVFSDPASAAGELQAVLPPAIVSAIDWSTLRHVPGSFVDDELRQHHSDLLFRAAIAGREARLYLLFEHQRTTDPFMAARLWRYVANLYASILRERPRPAKLPVVVPIVLHNGEAPWGGEASLEALLDLDEPMRAALGPLLPRFQFRLDDLAGLDEEAIRARAVSLICRLGLLALREVRRDGDSQQMQRAFTRWADALNAVSSAEGGYALLGLLVRYVLYTKHGSARVLVAHLATLGPRLEGAMKTMAEQLIEEGEARGLEKGLEEGLEKGRTEGRAEALLSQLRLKFGPLPGAIVEQVKGAAPSALDRWTAAVLTSRSLEETLR